jgi:hypothetical protein
MTDWTNGTSVSLTDLPHAAATYLAAHDVRDVDRALTAFTPDAEITDEGQTYRGRVKIGDWLANSGTEWTYTSETVAAACIDAEHYDVVRHLEGNFPGGVADLHFRFSLDGEAITHLVIEP